MRKDHLIEAQSLVNICCSVAVTHESSSFIESKLIHARTKPVFRRRAVEKDRSPKSVLIYYQSPKPGTFHLNESFEKYCKFR